MCCSDFLIYNIWFHRFLLPCGRVLWPLCCHFPPSALWTHHDPTSVHIGSRCLMDRWAGLFCCPHRDHVQAPLHEVQCDSPIFLWRPSSSQHLISWCAVFWVGGPGSECLHYLILLCHLIHFICSHLFNCAPHVFCGSLEQSLGNLYPPDRYFHSVCNFWIVCWPNCIGSCWDRDRGCSQSRVRASRKSRMEYLQSEQCDNGQRSPYWNSMLNIKFWNHSSVRSVTIPQMGKSGTCAVMLIFVAMCNIHFNILKGPGLCAAFPPSDLRKWFCKLRN